ncbi:MAG TPA: sulfite exporter TauE/SafE family protein [Candidatus Dietzia intestinipullorum]|nr:sulfite exporter TauE/SafE family protein [Candidatus Dietzia merdigallinarum]HJC28700.1 sulfite exporter TauE/SafE family protein [Candidatus Dietzia intestinipullorum]
MTLLLVCVGAFLGAVSQRLTGIGYSLISLPLFTVALGPLEGIVLAAVTSGAICAYLTWDLRERVDLPRVRTLWPWAVVGVIPGALLAAVTESTLLTVIIGAVLIAAIVGVPLVQRLTSRTLSMTPRTAGLFSGLVGALSGTPGIPLLLYSDSIRWDGRAFAASAQPVYVAIGVAVGLTQSAASTAVILLMPWAVWAVAAASVALGVLASYPLDRFVSPEAAVRVAKVLALLGAVQLLVVALL